MQLQHFEQNENAIVGSYMPSVNWSKYTHFAVMKENEEMLASCGFFQKINFLETWGFKEYLDAAKCIEQAQLYANAVQLFAMVDKLSNMICVDPDLRFEAQRLLNSILDISEPVNRLLGSNAVNIIEEAFRRKNISPKNI